MPWYTPGYALATCCCTREPPEQPLPIVQRSGPSSSMTRSLTITSDSACVMMLQLCPALSRACEATAKPRPSASSSITSGAAPEAYDVSQLAPCVSTSLLFHCFCGPHGCHCLPGCQRTAIAYWLRSE